MVRKNLYFLVIAIGLFSLTGSNLFAQLSPGDLHQSHKELEGIKNCTQCHIRGRQLSPEKCLDCHTLLRDRIKAQKGLHAQPDYEKCEICHIEHQGRESDLVYWDNGRDNFNHELTGYKLEGTHSELKCEICHTAKNMVDPQHLIDKRKNPDKTFLGLSQECLSCHQDEHRAQLDKDCLKCHGYNNWKPAVNFNHDNAKYVLSGSHKTVDCIKCHEVITDNKFPDNTSFQKFTQLQYSSCRDCHVDVHKGRFGANCANCHNTGKWENYAKEKFNHDKTLFSLKGMHAVVTCESCHRPGKPLKIAEFSKCMDCHNDYHQGQFKDRQKRGGCEECHTESGFTPAQFTLEQHNRGRYPLVGAHLAVPCIACHKKISIGKKDQTIQFKFQSMRCVSCHNDPHHGETDKYLSIISTQTKNNGCEHCHNIEGWASVQFDHNQSDYKLQGKHQDVNCNNCHLEHSADKTLRFKNIPDKCNACHEDQHAGQFLNDGKTQCVNCHTPSDWKDETFDHNKDSRFKLTGGHQTVPCGECHKKDRIAQKEVTRYKPLDTTCASCHGIKL